MAVPRPLPATNQETAPTATPLNIINVSHVFGPIFVHHLFVSLGKDTCTGLPHDPNVDVEVGWMDNDSGSPYVLNLHSLSFILLTITQGL